MLVCNELLGLKRNQERAKADKNKKETSLCDPQGKKLYQSKITRDCKQKITKLHQLPEDK